MESGYPSGRHAVRPRDGLILADATRLQPQNYSGTITVSASGLSRAIPVTLTIDPVPVIKAPPPETKQPPDTKQQPPGPKQDTGGPVARPPLPKSPAFSLDTYGGARRGILVWQGDLPPGAQLHIQGGHPGSGTIRRGSWEPGIPISIDQVSSPGCNDSGAFGSQPVDRS